MSTATSLPPQYVQQHYGYSHYPRPPSFTALPRNEEEQLIRPRYLSRRRENSEEFVKQSKGKGVSLTLSGPRSSTGRPTYGREGTIEGTVAILKNEGVHKVKVKLEGTLFLKEFAEGGTVLTSVCLTTDILYRADGSQTCPALLPFRLTLPDSFTDESGRYALPPTYSYHLSGIPGFRSTIEYSVTAVVHHKVTFTGNSTSVSSTFDYVPRTCPSHPIPSPLLTLADGRGDMQSSHGWEAFGSTIKNRIGGQDIVCNLYLPSGRVFSITEPVPFTVHFSSSALSLAAFLPLAPSATSSLAKQHTRIQIVRQVSCDVRGVSRFDDPKAKTDLWKTDTLGEGTFRHSGQGHTWCAWEGQIVLNKDVSIGGFKAGGLSVKDFVLLTVSPPDISSTPIDYLRQVIPVRLCTDPYTSDSAFAVNGEWTPPRPPSPGQQQ